MRNGRRLAWSTNFVTRKRNCFSEEMITKAQILTLSDGSESNSKEYLIKVNTDGVVTYLTREAVSQAAPVDAISSLGISRVPKAKKGDRN